MLSRYEGKKIRVTTNDGSVFTGVAQAFPSGYGLHEFGVAEESLLLDDTQIFCSEIVRIDDLTEPMPQSGRSQLYDALAGELLDGAYRVADPLPEQVPADTRGQYFAVERYFRQPEQLRELRRRQAHILLRLNCFCDMAVSFDGGDSWEINPDPAAFVDRAATFSGREFLRAIFYAQRTMIDIEPDDLSMTVYCRDAATETRIEKLAAAEGFFLWQPCED